jgi:TolB-like protein
MILSTSFSRKRVISALAFLIWFSGCAQRSDPAVQVSNDYPATNKRLLIAVLPITNLSGTPAPLRDIRRLLINNFTIQGLNILDDEVLERFIAKHRIRYSGSLDYETAQYFRRETGAEAVCITSVELYSEQAPPKISLRSRLVSTVNNAEILWMGGIGLAGDDSVGILELYLIEDPQILLRRAVQHLSTSLGKYLSGGRIETDSRRTILKFWPKVFYRSPIIESGSKYKVAVIPFFNSSQRRFAGEIIALHFVKQLRMLENFTLLEPGIVRRVLLKYRIIMDYGISKAQADILLSKLDVDFILTGNIFDYQDYQGGSGIPKVDFSSRLIERQSREVVWSCRSFNEGDDGVFFFDWGTMHTAYSMATEMVSSAVETIFE